MALRTARQESASRGVIVIGAERSGTSVVAEMVHRWGAYAGEPGRIRAGDEQNSTGYWEYLPIWDFLAELGNFSEGVSWWDESFQEHVRGKLQISACREEALRMTAAMQAPGRPWVWKDPALSFFLPFWKEIWGDVAYVVLVRNPFDTARSWLRFVDRSGGDGVPATIAANLARWQHIMLLILEHTEGAGSKTFIRYGDLVRNPLHEAGRLAAFLTCHCGDAAPHCGRAESMAQAVRPGLWHNRSDVPFREVRQATDAQKDLYELLQGKVTDSGTRFDKAEYPMPPGWRELVRAHGGKSTP